MVHKPKHRVHSFRGLLADGEQDEINLERQNLNVAYRIVKFQVMPESTGAGTNEAAVSIWRESQSSAPQEISFKDTDLLGCAYFLRDQGVVAISGTSIIFDNVLFSRNIYVNYQDAQTSGGNMNYYIELEEVPVNAATLMQLKLQVARKLSLSQEPLPT